MLELIFKYQIPNFQLSINTFPLERKNKTWYIETKNINQTNDNSKNLREHI